MAKRKRRIEIPEEVLKFFRKEGKRGGKLGAAMMDPAERSAIARKGAEARWGKPQKRKRR